MFIPPETSVAASTGLPHAGTYIRSVPVSLSRMYENALDWEHLPWVHPQAFAAIDCLAVDADGWRARVTAPDGRANEIQLRLDRRRRRWITRVLDGPGTGAEIWTQVFEQGPRALQLVIDFYAPGAPPTALARIGRAQADLYRGLYDQDVAMMEARQRGLDQRLETPPGDTAAARCLGPAADWSEPALVTHGGRHWVVTPGERSPATATARRFFIYPERCPHQLAPLLQAERQGGVLICPWHGDQFDLDDGRCISGRGCRLRLPYAVWEADGLLFIGVAEGTGMREKM